MTYKVIRKDTIARDFKTKEEAEDYAGCHIQEDEDTSWEVKRE